MKNEKSCITINMGCCGSATFPDYPQNGLVPVGTIIAYMGTKEPDHYLVCDGRLLDIADYMVLAEQIRDEFGTLNYFGGDGINTFAIPDLRDQFLRGYHGDKDIKLSAAVGVNQDATEHINVTRYANTKYNGVIQIAGSPETTMHVKNSDGLKKSTYRTDYAVSNKGTIEAEMLSTYISRPINVAVLYCIKYE